MASLTVRLEAETSQYQAQLASATKQLQGFQSSVAEFAEDIAKKFAAAFTVDKVAEFIENAIESAAALERLSQESGVAVEELSALAAVFAQSGVGQDEMASSLKKLNQAISDAAGNPTSKASFAFQALGLSITNSNGSMKTAAQLLPEIADAYSHLADGANKVTINTDLFGKSAQAMIPALNGGAQGLADLQAEAIKSGAALSGELAEAAEALEKKFNALKQSVTGSLSTQTLEALLPTLNALVDGMKDIGASATPANVALGFLNGVLKDLGHFALEVQGDFKQLGNVLSGVEDAAIAAAAGVKNALSAGFGSDASIATLSATAKKILGISQDTADQALAINKASNDALVNLQTAGGDKLVHVTEQSARAAASALVKSFDDVLSKSFGVSPALIAQLDAGQKKIQDFAASIKVQTDSFDKGAAAQTLLKLSTGALGDAVALAQKKYDELTAQGVNPYTEAAIKAADATLKAAKAAQALSVQQQAQVDTKEVTNYTDKLQEQVDKLTLGTLAATAYATTHGKLGIALRDTAIDGAAATANIIDLTKQIVAAGNEKTLTDLSVQTLELQGHLVAAADAAFALASKLPKANAASTNDVALQKAIDDNHALVDLQKEYQQQVNLTAQVRANEAITESAIAAQVASGQLDELAGQQKISDSRIAELATLTNIGDRMQHIADASGIPALILQSKQFESSLSDLAASTNALANKLRTDFTSSASDAFASFATGAESASQAAHQFLTSFETDIIKMATNKAFENLFGSIGESGGGGIFGALASFLGAGGNGLSAGANASIAATGGPDDILASLAATGGGLASGGPAMAGTSYTVGEHGAEEFVPSVDGTIVPNSKMSKGITVHNHFTIAAPTGTVSRQTQSQISAAAGDGVSRAQRRDR